jgi:hypothetical protein
MPCVQNRIIIIKVKPHFLSQCHVYLRQRLNNKKKGYSRPLMFVLFCLSEAAAAAAAAAAPAPSWEAEAAEAKAPMEAKAKVVEAKAKAPMEAKAKAPMEASESAEGLCFGCC